jgi:hypothetical protein
MRCEVYGEIAEYRIATEPGFLVCCSGERCSYKPGDYILTVNNPYKPGKKCEAAMNQRTFARACKVLP